MPDATAGQLAFGERVVPFTAGATIGAALWAAGIHQWRTTRVLGRPRSLFCGIGQCFDCLVSVNGAPVVRACVTAARAGDRVQPG
jgi:predicted molibdopterin-dependent oxidoreductase YjgC